MRDLTPTELHVLRHSLGTGEDGRNPSYRNHFVTGPNSSDHPTCMQLVDLGLMQRRAGGAISGGDDIFTVTTGGRAAAEPQEVPKLSRSARRYRNYLSADSGLSFGN
ncbi:hypothetical protein [Xanthomonas arboricola]|uniref:hypothetical protein n=1 Tax=Xanthomonas arboricola TaxID=56448 RepID=UPI000C858CF2|nr:hypothetical protein [Xanthomonas arboricola]PPU28671.1 hypothetical protein XarCFBP6762_05320 [Xanthomonas arboricola]SOT99609.1 hypothetical protein CFBP6762_02258 [Xanthomonas arboricola pv. fragariae]